jgi:hypothetical protein
MELAIENSFGLSGGKRSKKSEKEATGNSIEIEVACEEDSKGDNVWYMVRKRLICQILG